jgi:hypothetical protein
MSDVKRYDSPVGYMDENTSDGDYVEHADYAAAIAERDTLRAEVDRLQSKYHEAVALLRDIEDCLWGRWPEKHKAVQALIATIDAEESKLGKPD